MLLEQSFLDALVAGRVDLAFRRWATPRVKVGTRMRTSHGLVEVLEIDEVARDQIGDAEATRAGQPSREDLLARLGAREGTIFRIRLRHAGEDPDTRLRRGGEQLLQRLAPEHVEDHLDRLHAGVLQRDEPFGDFGRGEESA